LSLRMDDPWEKMFYLATRHSYGYPKIALVTAMKAFLPLERYDSVTSMGIAIRKLAVGYKARTNLRPTREVDHALRVPEAIKSLDIGEKLALRKLEQQSRPKVEKKHGVWCAKAAKTRKARTAAADKTFEISFVPPQHHAVEAGIFDDDFCN
jgi:hypothetical protein